MATREFTIAPVGEFSLREAARFGFGQRGADGFDGVMRLAFCLDGTHAPVGVELRQDGAGLVHARVHGDGVHGDGALRAIRTQTARVLSLDRDSTGYEAIGRRDPAIARLLAVAPGLRPPLFYSPYEAAVWSVLSSRRPPRQMARIRSELSTQHGTVVELAGQPLAALPTPAQLIAVESFPGITAVRLALLRGIARAAAAGDLDPARLVGLGPDAAALELQRIKGIGPFYSSLIVIRALGFTDVLPRNEPRILALVGPLYGLGTSATQAEYEAVAEQWRPWRTWVSVLIRAAASRLTEPRRAVA